LYFYIEKLYKENPTITGIKSILYLPNYIRDTHNKIGNIYIEESNEKSQSIILFITYISTFRRSKPSPIAHTYLTFSMAYNEGTEPRIINM